MLAVVSDPRSDSESAIDDREGGFLAGGDGATIARLEAELAVALDAAAKAENEQGRLQGELTKAMNQWAAACMAQEEWDRHLAERDEALRQAEERMRALEESRSWRLLQGGLAPYRWLRSRGG